MFIYVSVHREGEGEGERSFISQAKAPQHGSPSAPCIEGRHGGVMPNKACFFLGHPELLHGKAGCHWLFEGWQKRASELRNSIRNSAASEAESLVAWGGRGLWDRQYQPIVSPQRQRVQQPCACACQRVLWGGGCRIDSSNQQSKPKQRLRPGTRKG